MILNYIKSQSSISPELVDTTSSKKVVYLRKNVITKTETDEMTGEDRTYFEYEEAKLTKAEYAQYLKELEIIDIQQQRADIDYMSLMSDIVLEYNNSMPMLMTLSLDEQHSPRYNDIKKYYDTGLWVHQRVYNMVSRNVITAEEYKEITGEDYK